MKIELPIADVLVINEALADYEEKKQEKGLYFEGAERIRKKI